MTSLPANFNFPAGVLLRDIDPPPPRREKHNTEHEKPEPFNMSEWNDYLKACEEL